jgi:hypothetical protein
MARIIGRIKRKLVMRVIAEFATLTIFIIWFVVFARYCMDAK